MPNRGVGMAKDMAQCHCTTRQLSTINDISVVDDGTGVGLAALPGLSRYATAVLAGFLVALAVFIFLLVLICLCFGSRRRKHAARDTASTKMTDMDSVLSMGLSDGTMSQENLHEVDIKLPRAWLEEFKGISDDELDLKIKQMEESGWDKFQGEAFRGENEAFLDGSERVIETVYRTSGEQIANNGAVKCSSGTVSDYSTYHHSEAMRENMHGSGECLGDGTSVVYAEIRRTTGPEALRVESETDYSICADSSAIYGERGGVHMLSGGRNDAKLYSEESYSATSSSIHKSMNKENYMKIYWAYKRYLDHKELTNQTEA